MVDEAGVEESEYTGGIAAVDEVDVSERAVVSVVAVEEVPPLLVRDEDNALPVTRRIAAFVPGSGDIGHPACFK